MAQNDYRYLGEVGIRNLGQELGPVYQNTAAALAALSGTFQFGQAVDLSEFSELTIVVTNTNISVAGTWTGGLLRAQMLSGYQSNLNPLTAGVWADYPLIFGSTTLTSAGIAVAAANAGSTNSAVLQFFPNQKTVPFGGWMRFGLTATASTQTGNINVLVFGK